MAIGMQFSHFLVSFAMVMMAINSLLSGQLTQLKSIRKKKTILLFTGFYLLHIVGLCWSIDQEYGLHDLRIKLPLVVLPWVIGLSTDYLLAVSNGLLCFFWPQHW